MKQFILFILFFCAASLYGQQGALSLKTCIETGVRNNLSLKSSRIDVLKSRTALTQNRSKLLPVLSADFQMADYLMKPANVTTGALLGSDFPDDPTWQKIQSMQYAMTSGIQLGVPLYNQTILSATKVARTLQEISSLSYEKAVEDLTLQIGNVYYLAQASLEQQNLLAENIRRMEELCTITEELYKGGVVFHVALPDGSGAQCGGSCHRHFCLCQLVAGETAALHHPFCAGCPSGQSAVFCSVCPSGPPRAAARKRQFRGFPLGFYPDKRAGFLASHFGGDERHHRLYHLDLHGQRIISPMCTLL